MTIKALYPNVRPSLDLNFARTRALDPRITFTRASTGTFVSSDGLIKTAASGVPRFDHNPVTGESLGLLVEEPRTNSSLRSEDLSNSYWNSFGPPTLVSSSIVSPAGTSTACRFNITVDSNLLISSNFSGTYTMSVYAKKPTGSNASFRFQFWNGSSGITSSLFSITENWGRYSFTFTDASIQTPRMSFYSSNTGEIDLWGAQLEAGAFPTSYIPTTTATVTRSVDVASMTGTNFSSWYNQSQGTTLIHTRNINSADFSLAPFIGYDGNGSLWDNTQEYGLRYNSSGQTFEAVVRDSSAGSLQLNKSGDVRASSKAVIALNASQFAFTRDGLSVEQVSTSGPMSSVSRLTWDYTGPGPRQSSRISRLTYYPVRLPDAQLIALTQ
jgi:hypothetical protein